MINVRKEALLARLLRRALDSHRIAQAFQGLDGPLSLSCLLFGVTVIIPRLLITAPRSEKVVDDHEKLVGNGERSLLLARKRNKKVAIKPRPRMRTGGHALLCPSRTTHDPRCHLSSVHVLHS
jgi:hypothetical protein